MPALLRVLLEPTPTICFIDGAIIYVLLVRATPDKLNGLVRCSNIKRKHTIKKKLRNSKYAYPKKTLILNEKDKTLRKGLTLVMQNIFLGFAVISSLIHNPCHALGGEKNTDNSQGQPQALYQNAPQSALPKPSTVQRYAKGMISGGPTSCSKNCQSKNVCADGKIQEWCAQECGHKVGVLIKNGPDSRAEPWNWLNIWKYYCPKQPLPSSWAKLMDARTFQYVGNIVDTEYRKENDIAKKKSGNPEDIVGYKVKITESTDSSRVGKEAFLPFILMLKEGFRAADKGIRNSGAADKQYIDIDKTKPIKFDNIGSGQQNTKWGMLPAIKEHPYQSSMNGNSPTHKPKLD